MAGDIRVETEHVAIDDLIPYPKNPRRGRVTTIAESLASHGQYRPIVANRRTKHVLAGNHTLQAAKRLGWTTIAVAWVDVDDEDEARIVLADNRASDLATYDDGILVALLRSLPDLDGTGYTPADLDALEGLFDPTPAGGGSGVQDEGFETGVQNVGVRVGDLGFEVDPQAYDEWAAEVEAAGVKPVVTIRRRLRLPATPRRAKVDPESTPVRLSTVSSEVVDIADLAPYPSNAREGDVGAISESLRTLGQFRPIVVNRSTCQVLVGNHTLRAAHALGWTQIAVTWVDVDEEEARRIVLVDNRTSDLATYDNDDLLALLTDVNVAGTGYSGDDIDDLLSGGPSRPSKAAEESRTVKVGKWRTKVPADLFDDWFAALDAGDTVGDIARRLELPEGSWTPTSA